MRRRRPLKQVRRRRPLKQVRRRRPLKQVRRRRPLHQVRRRRPSKQLVDGKFDRRATSLTTTLLNNPSTRRIRSSTRSLRFASSPEVRSDIVDSNNAPGSDVSMRSSREKCAHDEQRLGSAYTSFAVFGGKCYKKSVGGLWGSNPRPHRQMRCALPTELRLRVVEFLAFRVFFV